MSLKKYTEDPYAESHKTNNAKMETYYVHGLKGSTLLRYQLSPNLRSNASPIKPLKDIL